MRFPLYIMYSHTYLIKKTAANVFFESAKVQRCGKTYKSIHLHLFNPLFCYFRDSKSVSLFITYKKKREKTQKISYFLLKYFADSEKSRTFAVHLRNKDAYLRHRNPYITMLRSLIYLHVSVIMKRLLFAAVILFTDSANVR